MKIIKTTLTRLRKPTKSAKNSGRFGDRPLLHKCFELHRSSRWRAPHSQAHEQLGRIIAQLNKISSNLISSSKSERERELGFAESPRCSSTKQTFPSLLPPDRIQKPTSCDVSRSHSSDCRHYSRVTNVSEKPAGFHLRGYGSSKFQFWLGGIFLSDLRVFVPSECNIVHCSFIGYYFTICFGLTAFLQDFYWLLTNSRSRSSTLKTEEICYSETFTR
jgi:hypothetical protein